MAQNLVTKEMLEVFAEQVNESCPVLEDANSTQQGLVGKKSGGKITVYIPDPGVTVVTRGRIPTISGNNPDVTNTDVEEFEKTFEICCATNACSINDMDNVKGIADFEKQISGPRCASVGAGIEEDIISNGFVCADSAVVVATADFGILSDMAGDLDDSRVKGELVGYMSGKIKSKISKTGSEKFNNEGIVGDLYRQAKIGEFANVAWKKTAMPVVETTAADAPSAITAVDGDAGKITVTIAANAKYPKGYAFKIAGIKKRDVLGKVTSIDKVFILKKDCAGADSAATSCDFYVEPFSATGAHANVSRLPLTTDTPTALLDASSSYAVIWAFSKGNLEFSPVKLPASGLEEVSASADNGKVVMSAVVNGDNNRNGTYRFDSAYIGGAVDSRRAVIGYVKL